MKLRALVLVFAVVLAAALAVAPRAGAHVFHFRPSLAKRPLEQRAAGQRRIVRHDRRVLAATSWTIGHESEVVALGLGAVLESRRFHAAQLRWTSRELRKTVAAIARRRASIDRGGSWSTAVASWYGPGLYGNGLACGGVLTPSWSGVANKTLACGTRLEVCFGSRCASTFVGDRGPFVAGREFDLGPGLAAQLGFGGVGVIRWRRTS